MIYPYCHTLSLHDALPILSQPGARAKTRWMEDCAGERRPGCSGKKLLAACQEAAGDRKRQILAVGQFNSVPHREIDPRITLARDIAVDRQSTRLNSSH